MTRVNKAEEKAYNYIKDQITTGTWPAPTKIVEQEISDILEISRSPVRAAIKQLAEEGYLEVSPYKGAVVAKKKLNKQEFVDRMEMLEMLLQQYLYLLDNHKFHLDTTKIQKQIAVVNDAIEEKCDIQQLSYLGTQLMEQLLVEQPNSYIRKNVISICNDILNVDLSRSKNIQVYSLYQIFINGINKVVIYLGRDEFPKARKEVRIFINRLMLEVIDQSVAL